MEDHDTALWLELPADCAFVPIERIRPLVLDTKLGHLDSKHGADGAFAALREAEALGFNNESTDTANIRRAIQERRAAGQLVVYEKDGFGVIRDDDFMRGALKREDFARLLGDEWSIALREPAQGGLVPETPDAVVPVPGADDATDVKPVARWRAQEQTILNKLRELQYSPCALPKSEAWKPGVKSEVRAAIGSNGMWHSPKVFDKAWERLRERGEIADKP